MDFSIKKIDETDLELWRRNNRKKQSADAQDKGIKSLEKFDLILLNNKDINKQNLQIAAELISLAQNNKCNNLEEAYGEYLTQKWNNAEEQHKNETIEVLKVFFNLLAKSLNNTVCDFGKRIAKIFDEDLLVLIGSGISNIGSICISLCEAVVSPAEERVMCPEFSFQS